MASNSRLLLLPLFLFTAMVAIAAAQPVGFSFASPAEYQHLTQFFQLRSRQSNAAQFGRLAATGIARYAFETQVYQALVDVLTDAVRRYCIRIGVVVLTVRRNPFGRVTFDRQMVMATATMIVVHGNFIDPAYVSVTSFIPQPPSP
ncbi:hypothetical protein AXF42_Ash000669 [Apostasia shenzhenica]|uniref:Uncharacterized protein n=1 Tax=Apostasia shenzhenica TaxID=1088818 RepID=A0A2I0AH12_9ASPA|nr:hypothetical protein AXF42_Ash000669 [Apostasia shenzhenica]